MRLLASDVISYYRPSPCRLRVYLRELGEQEEEPGPYNQVLRRLGTRHEQRHLFTLGRYLDLSGVAGEQRVQATRKAVEDGASVIYQGAFSFTTELNGATVTIVGYPDFLINDNGEYVVRDSKIARRINEDSHPELVLQVQLYGWLYEQAIGRVPKALQIHSGMDKLITVPYDGGAAALDALTQVLRLKSLDREPYEPVGMTKCAGCGFEQRCLNKAIETKDVAMVMDIDQTLASALHADGVETWPDLLAKFNAETLSAYRRPWGAISQKVGVKASKIIMYAEVLEAKQEKMLSKPTVPAVDNFVMFDLEGMPPQLDELDKIYVWGIQAFGTTPSAFVAAVAGFGPEGDREGWEKFLASADSVFQRYGDIPFVHWSPYERTYVSKYIQRYRDINGTAARIIRNLFDLYVVTKESVALPVPSFGLKVIEKYVGFKRSQQEYGGDWAMAKFIEATETADEAERRQLMDQILRYNQEDLEAMWAVLRWLQERT